jgi:hypothetical protein
VVLSCSYLVDEVRTTMGDGGAFGVSLRYAVEVDPLGTAGGVRNAVDLVGGLVVVLNGDILADVDLSAMLRFHAERGSHATIYLTRVADPTQYGLVELAPDNAVKAFIEKPEAGRVTTDTINAGAYVLDREVVSSRSSERRFPGCCATGCRSTDGSTAATGSTSAAPRSTARGSSTCSPARWRPTWRRPAPAATAASSPATSAWRRTRW